MKTKRYPVKNTFTKIEVIVLITITACLVIVGAAVYGKESIDALRDKKYINNPPAVYLSNIVMDSYWSDGEYSTELICKISGSDNEGTKYDFSMDKALYQEYYPMYSEHVLDSQEMTVKVYYLPNSKKALRMEWDNDSD